MSDPKIHAAKVRAAEDEAIAGIPAWMRERMDAAKAQHKAKGGCPGCGSMVLACHTADCPTNRGDLY